LHALVTSWHGWEAAQLGRHAEAGEIWRRGLTHAEQAQNQTARAYLLSKVGMRADDKTNTRSRCNVTVVRRSCSAGRATTVGSATRSAQTVGRAG
jgi:hypothetical protein